jgi:hypothetical protein
MKFAWPVSQKRELLKCGSMDSTLSSPAASAGSGAGDALADASPGGAGGDDVSGCCAIRKPGKYAAHRVNMSQRSHNPPSLLQILMQSAQKIANLPASSTFWLINRIIAIIINYG